MGHPKVYFYTLVFGYFHSFYLLNSTQPDYVMSKSFAYIVVQPKLDTWHNPCTHICTNHMLPPLHLQPLILDHTTRNLELCCHHRQPLMPATTCLNRSNHRAPSRTNHAPTETENAKPSLELHSSFMKQTCISTATQQTVSMHHPLTKTTSRNH